MPNGWAERLSMERMWNKCAMNETDGALILIKGDELPVLSCIRGKLRAGNWYFPMVCYTYNTLMLHFNHLVTF